MRRDHPRGRVERLRHSTDHTHHTDRRAALRRAAVALLGAVTVVGLTGCTVATPPLTQTSSPSPEPGRTPGTAVVLAVGDIACAPPVTVTATACRHGDVADAVLAADPDRFVALGDLQYSSATLNQFLGDGGYDDTFGALKDITLPVLGNHEYRDRTRGYFDYFDGPGSATEPPGARADGYYATPIGSWTFVALNTECDPDGVPGGCTEGSPQYEWLRAQLATTGACTMVAAHRPRWSTGATHRSYPELAALWDLMAENGVDVVLAGHNHVSEVFEPIGSSGAGAAPVRRDTGIRAFTAGAGGASMQDLTPAADPLVSALVARSRSAYGPLELTLGDGGYSWRFLPVPGMTLTADGTTGAFSGSDRCH
jgi:hypothetical protein